VTEQTQKSKTQNRTILFFPAAAAPPHHLHHRRTAIRRTTALSCLPFILFHTQNHNSSNPSEFFTFSVHR
jgi:hypothetical protein